MFLLIFIPLQASNTEFNTIRGFYRIKITGPLGKIYSGTKECDLKISGDFKKMSFGSVYEGQYHMRVELCGKNKEECE
jgi:hypothetical protein